MVEEPPLLIRGCAPFYATNADKTFPTPRGQIPGAGARLSVLTTASGVRAGHCGQTELHPPCWNWRWNGLRAPQSPPTWVIGDRLDTDIAGRPGARLPDRAGADRRLHPRAGRSLGYKPDLIAENLWELVRGD